MSPARRPWAHMTPAEQREAVHGLLDQSNTMIAFRLSAVKSQVARIAADLRREEESAGASDFAGADDPGLPVDTDEVSAIAGATPDVQSAEPFSAREAQIAPVSNPALVGESFGAVPAKPGEIDQRVDSPVVPTRWADMSPDQRRAAITALRNIRGMTSGRIAAELHTSRNAVIGYINRMKTAGVTLAGSSSSGRLRAVPTSRPKPAKPASSLPGLQRKVVEEAPQVWIDRSKAFDPIPGTTPLTLMDCGALNCRWPVSGLMGREPIFCGQPKQPEASYCSSHAALSYAPPTIRTRNLEKEPVHV